MISKILLDDEAFDGFHSVNSSDNNVIQGLNSINLFVGQNNSGKSRLIRSIFSSPNLTIAYKNLDLKPLFEYLDQLVPRVREILKTSQMADANNIVTTLSDYGKNSPLLQNPLHVDRIQKAKEFATSMLKMTGAKTFASIDGFQARRLHSTSLNRLNSLGGEILEKIDQLYPELVNYDWHYKYFPILRGLRPLNSAAGADPYKERTVRDYFKQVDLNNRKEIFTGLGLYEDTRKLLLGKRNGRAEIKSFEKFLSKTFFNNEDVTLIPDIDNDVLLLGIGDDERPIYEYGDGIQNLITLLYPLFFSQSKDLLIFIEEPENSLHPGLQRIFIETLMLQQFAKCQFFITTHSNHFLDLSLEYKNISIYAVYKDIDNTTSIENVNNQDLRILDLLGVKSSSVFLSNCSLWIEGITDRKYIKRFLELYQIYLSKTNNDFRSFSEDLHYSFIEYAGSNIAHYNFENEVALAEIFAHKISSRIMLIADSDSTYSNPKSEKAKRLQKFKRQLGDNFVQLKVREIENLVSPEILLKVIAKIENKSELIDDDLLGELEFTEYAKEYLGRYIEGKILKLKNKFADDSGTIYNKIRFCKVSVETYESFEQLSAEAKQLTKTIYSFIEKSNPK